MEEIEGKLKVERKINAPMGVEQFELNDNLKLQLVANNPTDHIAN